MAFHLVRSRGPGVEFEQAEYDFVHPSAGESPLARVNALDVARGDYGAYIDVAKKGDFFLHLLRMKRSQRQSRISGWMPRARSSFTLSGWAWS